MRMCTILGNALAAAGPRLMFANPDGSENCPICYLNDSRNADGSCSCPDPACPQRAPGSVPDFVLWIDRAADDQVAAWKALGNG